MEKQIIYSFLVSGLAGLATMLGTIVIFLKIKNTDKVIGNSLAFAAGVMFGISMIDLIPTAMKGISRGYQLIPTILLVTTFIVLGIIVSMFMDKIVSKGKRKNLFTTGILSMIILMLHNIPEGIITFITSTNNLNFGILLALAISCHNIPEGISISVPIYYSTNKKVQAILYTFIAGFSELCGAFFAYKYIDITDQHLIFNALFASIGGMMCYISFNELLPTSRDYNGITGITISFFIGMIFMTMCHFLLH